MRALAFKKTRALLVLALATAGLSLLSSSASAAAVSINLCATAGTTSPLPTAAPAVTVPVWGFSLNTGTCGAPTVPGPVLEVNVGDVVTVNLTSSLPGTHVASFELPGLAVAPTGTAGQYQFTASRIGTFAYQSPGDAGRQTAMGLYGALIVRPAGETAKFTSGQCAVFTGAAYGNAYTRECLLVLSALDPAFNAAPDTADLNDYLATYWLVNGRAYPDTAAITGMGGQNVLLRTVNAGFDNSAMALLGLHEKVLARDANPLLNPLLANAETIPAGGTEDAIATVPGSGAPSSNGFPLFNRQLHVTNGNALLPDNVTPNPVHTPGGQLIFIQP